MGAGSCLGVKTQRSGRWARELPAGCFGVRLRRTLKHYHLPQKAALLSLTCRAFAAQSALAARGCGEYQCDAPLTLLQSALDAARQANPDLVLWGGDTAPHLRRVRGSATLKEDTDERQRAVLDTFTAASHVFKAMFPSTPVLPQLVRSRAWAHGWHATVHDEGHSTDMREAARAVSAQNGAPSLRAGTGGGGAAGWSTTQGNHDFVPSGSDVSPQTHGWLAAVADVWAEWLPEDARTSLAWGGYYTVAPVEGLRVAVLNTQVCHVGNIHSFVDGGAAARVQLAWLKVRERERQQRLTHSESAPVHARRVC